jgi:hypothetical protein
MISPSVQISTVRASSGRSFATAFAHGALEVPPAIWIGRHCGAPARRNTQRHPYRGGRGGCRRRSQPPRDLVRSAGWCARRAAARPGNWRSSAGRAEFMYPTGSASFARVPESVGLESREPGRDPRHVPLRQAPRGEKQGAWLCLAPDHIVPGKRLSSFFPALPLSWQPKGCGGPLTRLRVGGLEPGS